MRGQFSPQHPLHQPDLQLLHKSSIAKQILRPLAALQKFVQQFLGNRHRPCSSQEASTKAQLHKRSDTLVQEGGSPAYKLVGNVQLSTPADKDPRKPKRPSDAVEEMRPVISEIFGEAFPWSHSHLRKAAEHLGFWNQPDGDRVHTGMEPITGTTLYYAKARDAVSQFAKQTPDDFVEVVGSQKTQQAWKKSVLEATEADNPEGDA